jgi:CBS-domain-containing membrane protein
MNSTRVRDVMTPHAVEVPEWVSVAEFIRCYVLVHGIWAFPVHDLEGRLTGLVTVRQAGEVPEAERASTRVGSVATPLGAVPMLNADDPLTAALEVLHGSAVPALVYAGGRLAGIVSAGDIAYTLAGGRSERRLAA